MNGASVRSRARALIAALATVAILGTLGWLWTSSLLPGEYGAMAMGHADYGGGPVPAADGSAGPGHGGSVSGGTPVTDLVADPGRPADVTVDLVAREEVVTLASGREMDGFTLNGTSPGPLIRAVQGQLVEVRLENASVEGGMTLHWHGVDVPNAMDGVAGVTQDAVPVGGRFVYRFVADRAGTYWYHSHQVSHDQVRRGLFGALVVDPPAPERDVQEVVAVVHLYEGRRTVNGAEGDLPVVALPGAVVRVRVVNTDNGPMPVWVSGAAFRLRAVDGTDLREPPPVSGQYVLLTAGGRADLELVVPDDGAPVRVEMGGSAAVVLGDGTPAEGAPTPQPRAEVDLLAYGSPGDLGFDARSPDRTFEYVIGRRPGIVDGRPGMWWTINGGTFPDVPMFTVVEGDVVVMRIENRSGAVHPMHLHGHHAVVLSRDGVAATGSPWWVDSLDVPDGSAYEVAFVADNPGIWMDHCHNLPHAAEGLMAHVAYAGYTTPFLVGGEPGNRPE